MDRQPMDRAEPAAAPGLTEGPAGWRPRLRIDLRCSLREFDGTPCYVVEDPLNSRFFRLGVREWTFISFLDGKNTVADAVELAAASLGPQAIAPAEAVRLCQWLAEVQLAVAPIASGIDAGDARPGRSRAVLASPFYLRIPLGNPDRALAAMLPWLQWAFGPQLFAIWLAVCAAGVYQILVDRQRFMASACDLFAPSHWPLLIAVWLVLKVVHELAHGLAAKQFKASVGSAGIVLIFFSPVAYIDVTAAWRIRSRWKRVAVSAAGMYVELGVAGLAALVWSETGPGWIHYLAHKVVLTAGLSTLLFNLNPLMRFDGYYILADLTGATNLYARGRAYVRYLGRRWLLGLSDALPAEVQGHRWIRVYGVLSFLWRVSACASLLVVSVALFRGLGVVLTAFAVAGWVLVPLVRLVRLLVVGHRHGTLSLWRATGRLGLAAGAVAAVLALPWPGRPAAPAVVEYAPLTHVRADVGGFVQRVYVEPGQEVAAGQTLAVLVNDDAAAELKSLTLEIEQSRIKSRIYQQDDELTKYQVELKTGQSLETKRQQLAQRMETLVLRAPRAGRVVTRNLAALEGTFLPAGAELLALGDENHKELQVSVGQEELEAFRATRAPAEIAVRGGPCLQTPCGAVAVLPRAATEPLHPALGAHCGGPLAVHPVAPPAEAGTAPRPAQFELLAPRFSARVSLTPGAACQLRAGQLATVSLARGQETIAGHLYRGLTRWATEKLARQSHG
jgi:putative peptide zinc metalloprotease protein